MTVPPQSIKPFICPADIGLHLLWELRGGQSAPPNSGVAISNGTPERAEKALSGRANLIQDGAAHDYYLDEDEHEDDEDDEDDENDEIDEDDGEVHVGREPPSMKSKANMSPQGMCLS